MEDPVVAADGHTYERRAIEGWFEKHLTSPITNLPLRCAFRDSLKIFLADSLPGSVKLLFPNIAVRSAISDYVRARTRKE
jgi:hypothetical protein